MSNIRHCEQHGEYHESESGCPECQDTERMAAGFDAALEITEGIVDGMNERETLDQRALRIGQEMDDSGKKFAWRSHWITEFARRLLAKQAQQEPVDALDLAIVFHHAYEKLSLNIGYDTRKETRIFDPESTNGKLMVATCEEVIRKFNLSAAPSQDSLDAKRLGHIYKQQMSIFIRPLMDYAEWIAAIDAAMREGGKS